VNSLGRRAAVGGAFVAVFAAAALAAASPAAASYMPWVTISPLRGAPDASPTTQISFLGVPAGDISQIAVRGSRSGGHRGTLKPYATGNGGSYVLLRPFEPGEQVTVSALETTHGGKRELATSFTVGRLYTGGPPQGSTGPRGATGVTGPTGATGPAAIASYASLPAIHPPVVSVTTPAADPALGDIFLTPADGAPQAGAMIVNPAGQMVWFAPAPPGTQDADLRVQQYLGREVLTYWQGRITLGHGVGAEIIDNTSYQQVAEVKAGNGYLADLHDFDLEPGGIALITVFQPVYYNLTSVGGPSNAIVEDCLFQEIDVRTGLVMFEWHALGHVPLSASYSSPPKDDRSIWDWFHINSIDLEPNGNILVSARNTWAVYQVGHTFGEVLWSLGGRNTSFTLGPGVRFAWQHDATLIAHDSIAIFDNEDTPKIESSSRAIDVNLDFGTFTATLAHQYVDPSKVVLSPSQGNVQQLTNADQFVGWGQIGIASEFSAVGALTFQLTLPPLVESYRAYRFPWSAQPAAPPTLLATHAAGATTTQLAASWNGATGVTAWQVLAGSTPTSLAPVGAPVPNAGFDTDFAAATTAPYVAVRALGAGGRTLATSAAQAVTTP
jgi:hypothetical protein